MTTLRDVCADLGPELLEVAIAPSDLDVEVRDVVVHDPFDEPGLGIGAGDLVLAVGVGDDERAVALLAACGAASAAAVVGKRRARVSSGVLAAADEAGVAVLTTDPEVTWHQLHALLRTSIGSTSAVEAPRTSGAGLGDLFALADATAAMAGGPVTIEDTQSRVLAFSHGGQDVDEGRMATILGRRVPERWLAELRRQGVMERLWNSDEVLRMELPEGACPRRAIAIRAAGTMLGSIWLAEVPGAPAHDADAALREAARIAALHLMRHRVADDLDRRLHGGMVANLLRGEGAAESTVGRLGLVADRGFVVMAVEIAPPSRADFPLLREQLLDLLVIHLQAYRREAAATALGDRLYVIVASSGAGDRPALERITEDGIRRARQALHVPVRAGIGAHVATVGEIAESRRTADQCLDLGPADRTVLPFDEVQGRALVADVTAFVTGRRTAWSAELATLREHDGRHGTSYVETLRAVLDALGDRAVAARRLHVHPNTLRYRLRRIVELTGTDLSDPDGRLALEIQLRAIPPER